MIRGLETRADTESSGTTAIQSARRADESPANSHLRRRQDAGVDSGQRMRVPLVDPDGWTEGGGWVNLFTGEVAFWPSRPREMP